MAVCIILFCVVAIQNQTLNSFKSLQYQWFQLYSNCHLWPVWLLYYIGLHCVFYCIAFVGLELVANVLFATVTFINLFVTHVMLRPKEFHDSTCQRSTVTEYSSWLCMFVKVFCMQQNWSRISTKKNNNSLCQYIYLTSSYSLLHCLWMHKNTMKHNYCPLITHNNHITFVIQHCDPLQQNQ